MKTKIINATFDDSCLKIFLEDGRVCRIFHEQDCCETVRLIDQYGELSDLVGKYLDSIDIDSRDTGEYSDDSSTITKLNIVYDTYHNFRQIWLGESNGYYSEGLSLLVDYPGKKKEGWLESLSTPWKP